MLDDIEPIRRFAEELRAACPDDADLIADMLEGETDLHEILGRLLRADAEAGAFADANKALAKTYSERASAATDRSARLRSAMQKLIEATGLRKIQHEYGTLSLRAVAPRPVFTGDPAELPDDLRRVTIAADMTAIKDALKAGRTVPGAHMGNGGETISIRRA